MNAIRRILTLAGVGLCSCFVAAACTGNATGSEKPFAGISDAQPMKSTEVLTHLFQGGRNLCAKADFLAKARTNQSDCLAYIEKTRPLCEQESLEKMPESVKSKTDLRSFGREFYRCLMP